MKFSILWRFFLQANLVLIFFHQTLYAQPTPPTHSENFYKKSWQLYGEFKFISGNQYKDNLFKINTRYSLNVDTPHVFGFILNLENKNEGAGYEQEYKIGLLYDYQIKQLNHVDSFFYGLTLQAVVGNKFIAQGDRVLIYEPQGGMYLYYLFPQTPLGLRFEVNYVDKTIKAPDSTSEASGINGQFLLTYFFN